MFEYSRVVAGSMAVLLSAACSSATDDTKDATPERCGDGIIQGGEECDSGTENSDSTPDACRTNCRLASCGDGTQDTYEECDTGRLNSDTIADACRLDCRAAYCGDGVQDSGEGCDDGDGDNSDNCPDGVGGTCQTATCGDGHIWTFEGGAEECDDGDGDNSDSCPDGAGGTCKPATCGDGHVWNKDGGAEGCDDGAADSATCDFAAGSAAHACTTSACGDGYRNIQAGEVCDDGYNDACGTCNADCTAPGAGSTCGDDAVCPETEACDDGYADACGSCNADCTDEGTGDIGTCGDGLLCLQAGEYCDDNNAVPGDGCNTICWHDPGCGVASCNVNQPTFPMLGTQTFNRTAGTEPIVTDGLTGLVWQGCSAGRSGSYCGTGANSTMYWRAALTYCWELSWGGYDDWNLPNEYELLTLVDYSASQPATDTTAFPNTPSMKFWTSSVVYSTSAQVWPYYVDFEWGSVAGWDENGLSGSVRCVRTEPIGTFPPVRFERSAGTEPVAHDSAVGYEWQGCPAGLTGDTCATGALSTMTHEGALSYCADLTWGGYDDWYLPNVKQVRSIVDNRVSHPSVDTTVFPATPESYFWSSTMAEGSTVHAWTVRFGDGYTNTGNSYITNLNYVRCVRNAP